MADKITFYFRCRNCHKTSEIVLYDYTWDARIKVCEINKATHICKCKGIKELTKFSVEEKIN